MLRLLRPLLLALALTAPLAAEQWGFWDYGPGAFGDQAWKEPVANAAALPASGNETGDVRVTLDDLAAHVWDGNSWESWASGGGSGTVTSIALAVPAEWTVSGSPITSSGTITIAEATQTANTVYSGPTTGAAAAPGFRALVSADVPNNAADTSGNAATATSATTAATANAGDSATAFFSSGTIEADRLPAVTALASPCTNAQVLGGTLAGTGVECQADVDTDTDDQTATEVAYTPTTGTNWTDPDPTHAGGALDALAARLTSEEAKADDDVPESGDFGAAGDLEADGTLSVDVVAAAEMADADHGDVSWSGGVATVDSGAVGLTELADDAGCTGGQAARRNAGDTAFECYTPAAGGIGGTLSATDLAIAMNSGTGGSTLQSSAATLTAAGTLTIPSGQSIDIRGNGTGSRLHFGSVDSGAPMLYRSGAGLLLRDNTGGVTSGFNAGTFTAADNSTASTFFDLNITQSKQITFSNGVDGARGFTGSGVTGAVVRLSNGSTGIGALLASQLVEANTAGSGAPNVLTATESGTVLTNEGATALNYHTLPSAAAGYKFGFIVADADGIRVTAPAGDIIHIAGGGTSTAGGYCESTTQWSRLDLQSINATDWSGLAGGTWTCDGP